MNQHLVTDINFEELEQKTSAEFVRKIKHTVDYVKTWEDNQIQFAIEEDEFDLVVLLNIHGSIKRYEYNFGTGRIKLNRIAWVDIRKFFDI